MQKSMRIAIGVILLAWRISAGAHDQSIFSMNPHIRSNLQQVYTDPYQYNIQHIGLKAVVEMKALANDGSSVDGPHGILTFEQCPNGVMITGIITGLAPGLHGFHVHEKGDVRQGCNSAGPHFNPFMLNHGAPGDLWRHIGDLGNIEAGRDGVAHIDITDHYLTLVGVGGIVGRTLVVHDKPDDLGRGGTEESRKTGSSGARLACGIIGFS